jgi:predicted nucleic acid-binding protein
LVGAAARHHSMLLVTRDLRAVEVYRRLEVEVEILT